CFRAALPENRPPHLPLAPSPGKDCTRLPRSYALLDCGMSYPTDARSFLVGSGARFSQTGVSDLRFSIVGHDDRLTLHGATTVSLSRPGAGLPVSVSISSPRVRSRTGAGGFVCHPATLSAGASNRASISWSCSGGTAMGSWAPWWM